MWVLFNQHFWNEVVLKCLAPQNHEGFFLHAAVAMSGRIDLLKFLEDDNGSNLIHRITGLNSTKAAPRAEMRMICVSSNDQRAHNTGISGYLVCHGMPYTLFGWKPISSCFLHMWMFRRTSEAQRLWRSNSLLRKLLVAGGFMLWASLWWSFQNVHDFPMQCRN